MPVKGCSPVGSTQVNLGPKSLNVELMISNLSTCMIRTRMSAHPKRPRVSAEMKWTPFSCVQLLISNCFLYGTPQRTTTYHKVRIKAGNSNITYVKASNKVNRNIIAFLSTKIVDRNIGIQFRQSGQHSCSSGFSYIFSSQEELFEVNTVGLNETCGVLTDLRAQILNCDRLWVINCHRLNSSKGNIFGLIAQLFRIPLFHQMHCLTDLDTQALHAHY